MVVVIKLAAPQIRWVYDGLWTVELKSDGIRNQEISIGGTCAVSRKCPIELGGRILYQWALRFVWSTRYVDPTWALQFPSSCVAFSLVTRWRLVQNQILTENGWLKTSKVKLFGCIWHCNFASINIWQESVTQLVSRTMWSCLNPCIWGSLSWEYSLFGARNASLMKCCGSSKANDHLCWKMGSKLIKNPWYLVYARIYYWDIVWLSWLIEDKFKL